MDSSQTIGKKEFRKEITKLKKDLKTFMSMTSLEPNDKIEQIKTNIFSSIDQLPILFMKRRKKISGADDPAKNLVGFGKPAFVDKVLVQFFRKNFISIEEKSFEQWFPLLSEQSIGSRIQLQSLFNLIIRMTGSRIKEKKREQISVNKMKDMDQLINITNEILIKRKKTTILNYTTVTSSDILKILNVFVSKDSEITIENKKALQEFKEGVRNENMIAKKLLESHK